MATVTLKDLMDPLSKIAAATQETADKIDGLIEVVTGGNSGGSMELAIFTELQSQTIYLKQIEQNTRRGGGGLLGGRGSKKGASEASKSLELLGVGAKSTAMGMLLWSFVPKKAISKFTQFVTDTFEALASQDTKKVQEGSELLGLMGDSILKFSKALALSAILLIPGMIAIPFLIISMTLVGGAVSLLGMLSKPINKGAKTLDRLGKAVFNFGIGLATFALTTMFILMQPGVLIGMVASIVLIGGAAALLGSKAISKNVRKGALNLVLLGAGLAIFSVGYGLFALATMGTGLMGVLVQSLLIVGIGGAAALVGKFGISNVAIGALSLALNGIGLAVFSIGYVPFANATKGLGLKDILVQSGLLLAIGGVMALAGLGIAATGGLALLGPLLFAAAGLSLSVLAPGLAAMKALDFKESDSKNLSYTLGAVAMAFAGTKEESGFFGNIANAFGRIGETATMGIAAAGYAAAGDALVSLSKGLTAFKKIGFSEQDSTDLAIALGSVTAAFAQAGGEPANPGGLFGAVFGNVFSPNATERGIDSVMGAGNALNDIVKGLSSFLDFKKKHGLGPEAFKEGGILNDAIKYTLGFVQNAFSDIAEEKTTQAGGFFNTLFAIKKNKVKEGIDSVMGAGDALNDIVKGLSGFLSFKKKHGLGPDAFKEGGVLNDAITETLGFVQSAFSAIAGEETTQAGGFFNTLFAIKKNKVKEGIDSVAGAGKELTNIALGLSEFQKLVKSKIKFGTEDKDGKYKPDTLGYAVTNSLAFVGSAFAAIGGMEGDDSVLFGLIKWDENKVEKGISAVKGAGQELTNIAKGLKTFQEMVDNDIDFSKEGKLGTAVSTSLTFVGDAFAAIGGMKKDDSALFGLIKWDESKVQKGIEAVEGAGDKLTEIATGLLKFSEIKNPALIATNISTLFTSIGDTFTKFYEKPETKDQLDHFQGFITELSERAVDGDLDKAAEGMAAIADAVNSIDAIKAESFANLFKGAGDLTTNAEAYQALVQAVGEIRDLLAGTAQGAAPGPVAEGTTITPQAEGDNNNQAQFNKLEQTLARINSTMSELPGAIQSIKIVIPD